MESIESESPKSVDLFGLLVRLEVAGWSTGPARADRAVGVPEDLGRLLKKCGWLQSPDGLRYDLSGEVQSLEIDAIFGGREVELRRLTGESPDIDGLWMTILHDQIRIWKLVSHPGGSVRVAAIASSLGQWLEQLVEAVQPSGVVDPVPLSDLAEVGDGVGWRLADLRVPVQLGSAPEHLQGQPYELDEELIWVGQRVLPLDEFVTETVPADAAAKRDEPDLDDLFGKGGGRPSPRTGLIMGLNILGIVLTVLGMACIAAPGGILVLVAWMHVETDQQRLESGYLPASDAQRVEATRRFTYGALVLVVFLFAIQGFLLCNGAYDVLLDSLYIPMWQSFVGGLLGAE